MKTSWTVPDGLMKENFIRVQRISAVVCWVFLVIAINEVVGQPSSCVVRPMDYEGAITVWLWCVSAFMVSSLLARDRFGFALGAAQIPFVIWLAFFKAALEGSEVCLPV